jgi:hypothetical protein
MRSAGRLIVVCARAKQRREVTMSTGALDQSGRREALLAEYGEVCSNFRELTEIRFKLLAFLPIAAAASTALADNEDLSSGGALPLFMFGLVATLGLIVYNARNDQLYNELVSRAAAIEREVGLPDGGFANRLQPWLKIGFARVSHGVGVAFIYVSSLALWLFGIFWSVGGLTQRAFAARDRPPLIETSHPEALIVAISGGLAVVLTAVGTGFWLWRRKRRHENLRKLAAEAGQRARQVGMLEPTDRLLVDACANLLRGRRRRSSKPDKHDEKALQRALAYARFDDEQRRRYGLVGTGEMAWAHLVANLSDLPPRWIHDVTTGRR